MRYLTVAEVLTLQGAIIRQSGGKEGLHDLGALESAVALPKQSFGGTDLYPTIVDKAAAIGFSLVSNHAFIDGNKRVGHAAMEVFLILNGFEIAETVDEQERVILLLADGKLTRAEFKSWLAAHTLPRK